MKHRCYLDIETTGIRWNGYDITVIGLGFEHDDTVEVVQLVGEVITDNRLLEALSDVDTIYTYNGSRFDLPFIQQQLGVNLKEQFIHHDLMYDCWKNNLKGGLKVVEGKLGIFRTTKGVDGWMAIRLWWDYINHHNLQSLGTLLQYNREDVANLRILREKLNVL
ncbi:MAG: ribonuclease H-like domain-containing protein [Sedimentisphaerales bacterium]|nr:ribonuclease H-like domain-containing protein [Sedimentisphaerales bacterium]